MSMEQIKTEQNVKKHICEKCNFKCSRLCDFKMHLLTAKHNREQSEVVKNVKNVKNVKQFICDCGKTYKVSSGLWKHKKKCSHVSNAIVIPENPENKPSLMDIITQNKEIMDMLVLLNKDLVLQNQVLVLQNKVLIRQNKENNDTIDN